MHISSTPCAKALYPRAVQKAIPLEGVAPTDAGLPRRFGRYQLVACIARDGMTEVFRATSHGVEGFEKTVLVKRVLPTLADDQPFVEAFLAEARQAVALSHANIVQVFDLGREEDTYFLAMEYVSGMDLARALRAARRAAMPLPTPLAVYIASEVARALDHAHRRKDITGKPLHLVHGGVSPRNVLLSYEGEVKLTDFGTARCRALLGASGRSNGRAFYTAPEIVGGREADVRADLYGLAATLYESLGGEPDAEEGSRPIAAQHNAWPEGLRALVDRGLARDPAARFDSAAQMYEALASVASQLGVRVGPHDLAEWLDRLRPYGVDPPAVPGRLPPPVGSKASPPPSQWEPVEVEELSLEGLDEEPVRETKLFDDGEVACAVDATVTRREATLVALVVNAEAPVAEEALRPFPRVAQRHGAKVLEQGAAELVLVFGVTRPDGRDMQRATGLALKLHAAALKTATVREPIATVGVGIHPVQVTVRADGSLDDGDPSFVEAFGIVKALAKAARNRVLASEVIAAAGGDQFESVPVAEGAVALKGLAAPARRRVAGRKDLFRLFGELLARAANEGAQVVEITGGPGEGKTRFLDEVVYRLRKMGHPVVWHGAACLFAERDDPLAAMRAMLRTLLSIDETDTDGVLREKARRLRDFGLTPEEMLAAGSVLGVVTTTSVPSPAGARGLRGALRKVFQGAVSGTVSVFAWDGAECMDPPSRERFRDLVADTATSPVLYVLCGRPGAWSGRPERHRIRIEPLPPDDVATLLALRLGNRAPPRHLVDDLVARCGGNPFYVEEQLRWYLEVGAVRIDGDEVHFEAPEVVQLPRTVRDLAESCEVAFDAPIRRVLRVLSSREATPRGVLAGALGLGAPSLDAALTTLRTAGLLSEEGGMLRVSNAVLRAVLGAPQTT